VGVKSNNHFFSCLFGFNVGFWFLALFSHAVLSPVHVKIVMFKLSAVHFTEVMEEFAWFLLSLFPQFISSLES